MVNLDLEKLADRFKVGSRFMNEEERIVLAAAIETIVLEGQAGRLEGLDEESAVLLGAAVADELLKE